MVSLKSLAVSALAALPIASAYVNNVFVPETAKAGSTIKVTIQTSIYIQNWDDFGVIFGIAPGTWACDGCVGTEIVWKNFHGSDAIKVPDSGNVTVDVTLPASYGPGKYAFTANIPYLVGASGMTGFSSFSSNITLS